MTSRQERIDRVTRHRLQWDSQQAQIMQMHSEGVTVDRIAYRLLLSERTIYRRLHMMGLTTPPPPRITEDELLTAKKLLESGSTYTAAAAAIGRSAWALCQRLPGYRVARQRGPDGRWV